MRDFKTHNLRFLLICLTVTAGLMEGMEGYETMVLYRLISIFALPALLYLEGLTAEFSLRRAGKLAAIYLGAQIVYSGLVRLLLPDPGPLSLLRPWGLCWYVPALLVCTCLTPALRRLDGRGRAAVLAASLALSLAVGYVPALDGVLALSRIAAHLPYFLAGWFTGHPLGDENPALRRTALPFLAGLALIGSGAVLLAPDFDAVSLARSAAYAVSGSPLHRAVLTLGALGWVGLLRLLTPDRYLPLVTEAGSAVLSVYLGHGVLALLLRAQGGITGCVPLAVAGMVLTALTLALFLGGPSGKKSLEDWRELRQAERKR